jgi:hypothetical protein
MGRSSSAGATTRNRASARWTSCAVSVCRVKRSGHRDPAESC